MVNGDDIERMNIEYSKLIIFCETLYASVLISMYIEYKYKCKYI